MARKYRAMCIDGVDEERRFLDDMPGVHEAATAMLLRRANYSATMAPAE
jgi:hypothetical protein